MRIRSDIPKRYAKALIQLREGLEKREEDMKWVSDLIETDHRLRGFLLAPQINRTEKENLVKKVFGGSIDPVLLRFLLLLVHKGRIPLLDEIAVEFSRQLKELMGVAAVDLITAHPVDEETVGKIKTKLKDVSKRAIELKEKVDPKIIGGAILVMGNRMVDHSVRGRLARLKETLLAAKV